MAKELASGLLASLTLMGASRKVLGLAVERYLVPHRADIGIATFFSIGFSLAICCGLVDGAWGPGGSQHPLPTTVVQLGYLLSLIARRDFSMRLILLLFVWFGLLLCSEHAVGTVVLEVVSLWVVKLHICPVDAGTSPHIGNATKGCGSLFLATTRVEEGEAPDSSSTKSKSRSTKSKGKSKASGGRKR